MFDDIVFHPLKPATVFDHHLTSRDGLALALGDECFIDVVNESYLASSFVRLIDFSDIRFAAFVEFFEQIFAEPLKVLVFSVE